MKTMEKITLENCIKGENWSAERCAAIIGCPLWTAEHALGLIALRDIIIRQSADENRPLSCCIRRGGIHIHTDAEAAEYYHRRSKRHVRGIGRSKRLMDSHVDTANLSFTERQAYDRRQLIMALQQQALRRCATSVEGYGEI
jgi:hypothetical protein